MAAKVIGAVQAGPQVIGAVYGGDPGNSETLPVDSASYTFSSPAIGLSSGQTLPVDQSAYTFASSPIGLSKAETLPVDSSSYVFTPSEVNLVGDPELPREYIDTTYAIPTGGTTRNVNQGDDLQATLDIAVAGDVIVLEAGATFTGNFRLPNKVGTDWIYIISSALDQMPEGTRVGPADAANMPKLVSANSNPTLMTVFSSHNYRIAGVEISNSVDTQTNMLMLSFGFDNIGDPQSAKYQADTLEKLPDNITFDRVYIHPLSTTVTAKNGILADGRYVAVIDSYISGIVSSSESHGIQAWGAGVGPYKIANNFIEASGINIMFGGESVSITNSVPSDIEVRRNYLYKDPAWEGPNLYKVKNLFELKSAQRVLVSGNVMENSWLDGQDGYAVLFSPGNQNDQSPWVVVQDVTFENNRILGATRGFNIVGSGFINLTQQTKWIKIRNNDLTGFTERAINITSNDKVLQYLTVENNLMLHDFAVAGTHFIELETTTGTRVDGIIVRNNAATFGDFGINRLNAAAPYMLNETIENNGFILNDMSSRYDYNRTQYIPTYLPGNVTVNDIDDADFTDYANGDYLLLGPSPFKAAGSDGEDIGPNWAELNAATSGVVAETDTLVVDSATYIFAASTIGLSSGQTLPVDPANYVLSSSAIGLSATSNLLVDSASYSFTSPAIGLQVSATLPVESATYVFVGQDVVIEGEVVVPIIGVRVSNFPAPVNLEVF